MNEPRHPRHRLDELIHTPVRLSVMAALSAADSIDFRNLRNFVEVSDSLLSKHLAVLEEAGYVSVQKGFEGKRARTWLSLTDTGRKAYGNYIAALRSITDADS
ncbi:MAG TPA: transcriptional regulator [Acidimicrobiia bacterium]|nr:transcriptional regulator [Acidimicrobiia bacterium]